MANAVQHGMGEHLAFAGAQYARNACGKLQHDRKVFIRGAGEVVSNEGARLLSNSEQLGHAARRQGFVFGNRQAAQPLGVAQFHREDMQQEFADVLRQRNVQWQIEQVCGLTLKPTLPLLGFALVYFEHLRKRKVGSGCAHDFWPSFSLRDFASTPSASFRLWASSLPATASS